MTCKVDGCIRPVFSSGYCSMHYERKRRTGTTNAGPRAQLAPELRFWKHVDKRGPDECWNWVAKSKVDGYGTIAVGGRAGKRLLAHRFSWMLHYGELPTVGTYHGVVVMHSCDNRACVNPAHLRIGTQGDNVRDMDAKARRVSTPSPGSKHHNAKFTEADVREIRASNLRTSELARRYGVDRHTISGIKKRKTWRHVT